MRRHLWLANKTLNPIERAKALAIVVGLKIFYSVGDLQNFFHLLARKPWHPCNYFQENRCRGEREQEGEGATRYLHPWSAKDLVTPIFYN